MSDLVQRLQAAACFFRLRLKEHDQLHSDLTDEAAVEIERLSKQLENAEKQLAVSFTAKQYHHMRTCLANERNAVQDQLDKCRADAFEECAKIAEEKYVDISWHGYYRMAANGIAGKIRRSALTEAAMKSVSDAHWPDPH